MDNSARANYILTTIAAAGLCFIMYSILTTGPIDLKTVIGLALTIPSAIILIIARVQLGSSFALTAQAKHLVTGGIYSKFRHPIYLFAQIVLLGLLLCVFHPGLLVVWVLLLVLQITRAKKEEKILEEKFGEEYLAYKKKTWL